MMRSRVVLGFAVIVASAAVTACFNKPAETAKTLGALEAECQLRIRLECKPKDRTCPVYLSCLERLEQWRKGGTP